MDGRTVPCPMGQAVTINNAQKFSSLFFRQCDVFARVFWWFIILCPICSDCFYN